MDWNSKKFKAEYQRRWHKIHPWYRSHISAQTRCNNQKNNHYHRYGERGIKFLLIVDETKQLWFRDKAYNMKKPSIDRKDNDGNYEFNNCRFIEMVDNIIKANKETKFKNVFQYDLQGNFIKFWKSGREIERTLKFNRGNISKVCLGKSKMAYGFIWKFNEV